MPHNTENESFDVFISYNSKDRVEVKEIAEQLKGRGIKPWLDVWDLRPGLSWQDALEKQIEHIHAATVFVGKEGIGPWQHMEVNAYLRKFVQRGSPVIPALLKDAPHEPLLPTFLQEIQYVDFRKSNQDPTPIDLLIWGIMGNKPKIPAYVSDNSHDEISAPSLPAPMNTNISPAKVTIGNLSFQKKAELVSKLLACSAIKDRHSRDIVVQQLPNQISHSISHSPYLMHIYLSLIEAKLKQFWRGLEQCSNAFVSICLWLERRFIVNKIVPKLRNLDACIG